MTRDILKMSKRNLFHTAPRLCALTRLRTRHLGKIKALNTSTNELRFPIAKRKNHYSALKKKTYESYRLNFKLKRREPVQRRSDTQRCCRDYFIGFQVNLQVGKVCLTVVKVGHFCRIWRGVGPGGTVSFHVKCQSYLEGDRRPDRFIILVVIQRLWI